MLNNGTLKTGSNEMELVDFRIFKQSGDNVYEGIYGVNVAKVREIIKMPNLTELPGVPEYIEAATVASNAGTLDKGKITGVTRIENDEVLLILDLESVVEELGIYSPKMEVEIDQSKLLSGLALVLDDSSTARKLVKDMLEKMGLKVVEAKDGVEGLARMEDLYEMYGDKLNNFLRVILSDIEMPQMDGYRFASTIKDDPRYTGIPIIFNSSLSNDYSEAQSKEAGAAAYLTKFDASLFYNEVLRVIEAHKK